MTHPVPRSANRLEISQGEATHGSPALGAAGSARERHDEEARPAEIREACGLGNARQSWAFARGAGGIGGEKALADAGEPVTPSIRARRSGGACVGA